MSTIDYSAWDHIYVSDDEDVTSPFVDTSSLFRMRHRARLERTADVQQRREDLEKNCAQCRQRLEDAQLRLRELGQERKEGSPEDKDTEAELRTVQAEVRKLEKEEKVFEKLMTEHRREEKKIPWNVDTISKEGFSRSVFNIEAETEEEEEDAEKRRTFLETHGKEIKHFGMLRRWDDSQKYLSDNPQLVCEETAHGLVSTCIDLEIDQKHGLMEQVAHQALVMHFILDLSRTLRVDPRGCFRRFFSKIKTADKPYLDAFDHELELLKERIHSCALIRTEGVTEDQEEEEEEEQQEEEQQQRQRKLGPSGLDPVEVYQSLPKELQKSFAEKNLQMLQEVMNKLEPEEAKYHLKRCIDSGLWVPDTGEGDEEDEEDEEEDDDEDGGDKNNDTD
ncbi:hsp90 co-chaperone Cdc37-like [Cynoglossus semilaevis]|uniref:hsp90 co-chaperone Cdc37-like n=1 Tax=Cynoglossus semilaevis TaxID=244447 RepID=UPI000494EBEC|nr:hsp90 co-chaperone Cdc37-like [Cynoglossus semilaevis]